MIRARFTAVRFDGSRFSLPAAVDVQADCTVVSLSRKTDTSGIAAIEAEVFGGISGDDPGYFLLPRCTGTGGGNGDHGLCIFSAHDEDFSVCSDNVDMRIYGVKSQRGSALAIVTGMAWDYELCVERKDGKYRVFQLYRLNGGPLYEDIAIEVYPLRPGDGYNEMARCYREWLLERGMLTPLAERAEKQPALAYALKAPVIRVRCGWKPAPAEILHQTRENEPPMRVACTFERVGEFMDELKRQGVEEAEICLVGWNIRGHDGRWPEAFPVEPALGGEEGLRRLIEKAKKLGYRIACHTNHTDHYEIAESYSADNTRRNRNGEPVSNAAWSGGQMFDLCPEVGLSQAKEMFPKIKDLGFDGLHYVDVIGVVMPRECTHPDHPVTRSGSVVLAEEMARNCKEVLGGFTSEGIYDYLAPHLDYGLYGSFGKSTPPTGDRSVPLAELVYHGYVLYNPYTFTVNPTCKGKDAVLKLVEYGGRPSFYLYSAFMSNGRNWMGKLSLDPICDTDEQLRDAAAKVKEGWELYQQLGDLMTRTMERHEQLSDALVEVTYSGGVKVRVDYEKETFEILR